MTQMPWYEQPWPEGDYRFFQLGFVVDDVLAAAADWARVFRIGPFHVFPRIQSACTYRGTDTEVDMQVATAQAGPVQIELIAQYGDQPSVYRDLFAEHESGFHQLATITDDYAARRAAFEALGYEVVCEFFVRGQHVGYVDTVADFGFFTEIIEAVPGFVEALSGIARTCAQWDGTTDPVRILTREGYRTP